jgi:hypothetical protein
MPRSPPLSLSSSLRKLTRRAPPKGTKRAVLNAMEQGDLDDRGAALIMASLVDGALLAAINHVLLIKDPKLFGQAFYLAGPFASFDQRIIGARALRIIGDHALNNLQLIKDMRNTFAHAMSDVSFGSEEIITACEFLLLTPGSKFFVDLETERKTRFQFGFACQELYINLLGFCFVQSMRGHPPALPENPILP